MKRIHFLQQNGWQQFEKQLSVVFISLFILIIENFINMKPFRTPTSKESQRSINNNPTHGHIYDPATFRVQPSPEIFSFPVDNFQIILRVKRNDEKLNRKDQTMFSTRDLLVLRVVQERIKLRVGPRRP